MVFLLTIHFVGFQAGAVCSAADSVKGALPLSERRLVTVAQFALPNREGCHIMPLLPSALGRPRRLGRLCSTNTGQVSWRSSHG